MANFHTHLGTSLLLGAGIGGGGFVFGDFSPVSCALAGGLCGIAGILPDVDSENGIPLRESTTFLASFVPMMVMDTVIRHYGRPLLEPEARALAAAGMYLFVRFVLAEFIRRTTVHRGMWHSIPAACIAGLATFFICTDEPLRIRGFKVAAVIMGFLSHLLLDEMYSVEPHRGRMRVKRTFGTALKLWGPSQRANVFTYGLLLVLGTVAINERGIKDWRYATQDNSPILPPQALPQRFADEQSDPEWPAPDRGNY